VTELDPDLLRRQQLKRWERAAAGWGKRSAQIRAHGMPVSIWMIQQLGLHPGHRVLELAAGPGDTGLLAAELVTPGGTLVCSDATPAMLEIAQARAHELQIENVEFAQLELEWIDLPTASVDAVMCRWGVMLCVDPEAALREMRRVLRPGGRVALAVWDEASRNPWATIPAEALVTLGHAKPPDPGVPGMFTLAAPGALQVLLETAGFLEILVDGVDLPRHYAGVADFIEETADLSPLFADTFLDLWEAEQIQVIREIESLAAPMVAGDGSASFLGRSLVAAASA
jgi:SAM-dependent methyltransferase